MSDSDVWKAFGLPENLDPNHKYVFRSGSYGIYDYWWIDPANNYWKYTNAAEDSEDYDPFGGNPLINPDQPMPHTAPQFYSQDGTKRNVAVPPDVEAQPNQNYNKDDASLIWWERYQTDGGLITYVYKDTDVRQNPDLWVQQLLRSADAGLVPFRKYASQLFASSQMKDKIFGLILMLTDQAFYNPYDLVHATCADLEFVDNTVKLLGRKFLCDVDVLDLLTLMKKDKDVSSPLFELETMDGSNPIGVRHVYSMFSALKMSPEQLLYLNANIIFANIVHRLYFEGVQLETVEDIAYVELSNALGTAADVRHLVDYKTKESLLSNYRDGEIPEKTPEDEINEESQGAPAEGQEGQEGQEPEAMGKSLTVGTSDSYGVPYVFIGLVGRKPMEAQFSKWIHAEPLHPISEEEEDQLEEAIANAGGGAAGPETSPEDESPGTEVDTPETGATNE